MPFSSSDSREANDQIKNFLPMTHAEMLARGWDAVDIVFVTGDAYVDHPSFAAAVIGRVLEAEGLRVAILAQPDWKTSEAWKTFGRPEIAFCISAGNVDSMVNHYTANRKRRNDDAYSPSGVSDLRPDRATSVYAQRAREAFTGVPIIIGGIEASLRRISHYDYWNDKVRRSVLLDSKADLLVYGHGETPIREIVKSLQSGEAVRAIRNVRGTVYRLGASEDLPEETPTTIHLPSHEEVAENSDAGRKFFTEMTRVVHQNTNPYSAATLVQQFEQEAVVVNPPSLPLAQDEMDKIAALPFTRLPHPSYAKKIIPAFTVIRDSIIAHRGCFGGCAFCSLSLHQGKIIQSRSETSILAEVDKIVNRPASRGIISDIGGPSANMYKLGCTDNELRKKCKRLSCLVPKICEKLATDHHSLCALMNKVRERGGVKAVFIASGVRTDLALCDKNYLHDLVAHHVGGHLKTAPEHTDPQVLQLMNKPPIESHNAFTREFFATAARCGRELYLVPYLMAGLPGSTLSSMVRVAEFLMREKIHPEQVQDFIPTPMTIATSIYYTGIDPVSGDTVATEKGLRARRLQKAMLLYYDPTYYHDVKSALKETGREDLIGKLIPKFPSKEQAIRQSSRVRRLQMQQLAAKRIEEAAKEEALTTRQNARNDSRRDERNDSRRDSRPATRGERSDTRRDSRDFRRDAPRDAQRGERNNDSRRDSRPAAARGERSDARRDSRDFRRDAPRDAPRGDSRNDSRPAARGERSDARRDSRDFRRDAPRDAPRGDSRNDSRPAARGERSDARRDSRDFRRDTPRDTPRGERNDARRDSRPAAARGERSDTRRDSRDFRRDAPRGERNDSRPDLRGERSDARRDSRDFRRDAPRDAPRGERNDARRDSRNDARGEHKDSRDSRSDSQKDFRREKDYAPKKFTPKFSSGAPRKFSSPKAPPKKSREE